MANTETGWTTTYPSLAYGSWFWLRHAPDATPELHQLTGGRSWMESFGIVRATTEFLGPVTVSDAEQLSELRRSNEALSKSLKEFCGANGEAVDRVRILTRALRRMLEVFSPFASPDTEQWREEHEACEYARAALNPQPEKETQ